jgi:hypothetical protein
MHDYRDVYCLLNIFGFDQERRKKKETIQGQTSGEERMIQAVSVKRTGPFLQGNPRWGKDEEGERSGISLFFCLATSGGWN